MRVALEDLEHALFWVSSPPEFDARAYLSRSTGKIFTSGPDGPVEDDFPEDIDDVIEYIRFPHKNDLDLGRTLVLRFVAELAPEIADTVREAFRSRGAYARFKRILERRELLSIWHEYENQATRHALVRWAVDNGFEVGDPAKRDA